VNDANELVIEAKGLARRYGSQVALAGIDLRIRAGRIVGLIGPNGAGKTTALKAIMGLIGHEGSLRVLGLDPRARRHELMQQLCFIADVAVLPPWLKVGQAVELMAGVHPRFSRDRCMHFLGRTSIRTDRRVRELSKGMVTQLHLALVMGIDARLLVLDEPTLGLDIMYRQSFYEQLLNDYFDENRTILVTTHQVEEIERILTDVVFIRDGQIVLDAAMDDIPGRFIEVAVRGERLDAARALGPLYERQVFGKSIMLFADRDASAVADLGETRVPGLADLFVAKMKEAA